MVQMKSWRGMLIAIGTAVAGGLTIVDVAYGILDGSVAIENVIVDISANIIGGLSTSVVFFFVLWTSLLG